MITYLRHIFCRLNTVRVIRFHADVVPKKWKGKMNKLRTQIHNFVNLPKRKIIGIIIRVILLLLFFLIPIILAIIMGAFSAVTERIANVLFGLLDNIVKAVNLRLRRWESNTPEGTMERLRAEYPDDKDRK